MEFKLKEYYDILILLAGPCLGHSKMLEILMKKNPAEAGLIDHSVNLAIKLQLIEA